MLNSNRKYSIAISYTNTDNIVIHNTNVNELLLINVEENDEVNYSCQEYTDDILDLMIGKCIYIPMRDNLGDMLIKRLK